MSLFTESSLCLVPSGVKDGKVYSIKPTDGSGDLTFSRGSDIEATRVASNGYIEKAKVNLLLQSNTFDTTWSSSSTTETSGQAGYDGTNDAWLLDKSAASGNVNQNISASGVNTFSVYAKAGSESWVALLAAGPNSGKFFQLSGAGVVGVNLVNAPVDASIESVGGGWYRISMVVNGSVTQVRIYPAEGDGVSSGTSGNIYIQDAQLNYGLVAQEYQETTTTSVVSGITNDMPRLDYSGGASCPSLLLEPSRSNLFTYDTYLNGITFIQATATQNTDISPEGVQNAARLYDNTVNAQHRVGENISVTSGTTYTWSVFAKKGTLRYCYLLSTANGTERYFFDLQEGTAITSGGTIEDYGNGWYRLSAQATASATGSAAFGLDLTNDAQDNTYVGTGTDYHIVYGFQCETGSYVSSLIPTYGTSATRTADSALKTGISSLIGQTEGTMFVEAKAIRSNGGEFYQASISDGTANNAAVLGFTNTAGQIRFRFENGGAVQAEIFANGVNTSTSVKMALAYKANDFVMYVNGVQAGTDTSGSVPSFTQFQFANGTNTLTQMYGNVNQVLLFKTRLSNADLATLTA